MRKFRVPASLILVVALFGLISPASATRWESKVDAWVLDTGAEDTTEFLVMLKEQADLSAAARLASKAERGQYVYQTLSGVAQRSQAPVIAALQRLGAEYRAYWVVNALWVRGDLGTIAALAQRPDVQHLYANPRVRLEAPVVQVPSTLTPDTIEWNIVKVGAPEVWAQGYTGQGVVVGGADTGYDWEHPALINQYRGWDSSTASHDYNWFDATVDHSLIPVDPYGHGTHTMGIIVGDDGATNQIGMAPGARWIGCRNMDAGGYGTPATYIACYQWFIAPTRVDGVSDPRPDLAPDVINNSWACLVSEGCDDPEILHEVVQNVRTAGILTTHSAGNNGPTCSTINTPAAIYAESFTVGATDSADNLASISSRGPVTVDGSNRRKPDISAPGVNIRSCTPGDSYTGMTGTSMAAPHVAGLVALLISANPDLRGQVDSLEAIIELSALHKLSFDCSSVFSYPNNLYGWGRIQAQEAVKLTVPTLTLEKSAAVESISPSQVFSYTLTVTNTSVFTITNSAVLTDTLPVGTEFYAASEPYFLSNTEVIWNLGQLAAGKVVAVELGVRVGEDAGGEVVNADYGVSVINGISVVGEPVVTAITRYIFLPLIVR